MMKKLRKRRKSFNDIPRQYILRNVQSAKNLTCRICGKQIKSIAGFGTHLLNRHNLTLEQYIVKYFTNLTKDFKFEKCGFCERNAKPTMSVDYQTESYSLLYDGYFCHTESCKDNISLDIFGMHYDEAYKQGKFEHIGANTEYLSRLYKKPKEYIAQKVKRNENYVLPEESRTSLKGYISRYGEEQGTILYKQRCTKISRSMKIEWFIERYGIEEGTKKYQERYKKCFEATSDITHSKNQYVIFNALKENDSSWEDEKYVNGIARVDMVNYNAKIAIEYFGDFWHCNPCIYKDTYYNKMLRMYALEKQALDKARLNKILSYGDKVSLLIVIWEKSFYDIKCDVNKMLKKIYNIIALHDKSKKEIIWI